MPSAYASQWPIGGESATMNTFANLSELALSCQQHQETIVCTQ